MGTFTKAEDLFGSANQSIGGNPTEGGNGNEAVRIFQPDRGLDVLIKNMEFVNRDEDDLSTGITSDMDGRRKLGTITLNNRDFWENNNYNENTFSPYLSNLREVVDDQKFDEDGNGEEIVFHDKPWTMNFSIDAIPFVINPNTNEIIRLDRYHDKNIHSEKYNLATEGKINYYIFPRRSGRTEDGNIDTYGKKNLLYGSAGHGFDSYATGNPDIKGYHLFRLDWGDNTPLEYTYKTKLLEGTTLLEHDYKKPGFYTIKGVVMAFSGYNIRGWEKFETNILINQSIDYDVDLYNYENFATIGGISPNSVLVKSTANILGLNPITLDDEKTSSELVEKINLFDRLNLFNFFTKINSNYINKFSEEIEPYMKDIFDEPEETLVEGIIWGCKNPDASNYNPYADEDDGNCIFPLFFNFTVPPLTGGIDSDNFTVSIYLINDISDLYEYPPEEEDEMVLQLDNSYNPPVVTTVPNEPAYTTSVNRRNAYIDGLGLVSSNNYAYMKESNIQNETLHVISNVLNSSNPDSVTFTYDELSNAQMIIIKTEINGEQVQTVDNISTVIPGISEIPLTNNLKVYGQVNPPVPSGTDQYGVTEYNDVVSNQKVGYRQIIFSTEDPSAELNGTYDIEFDLVADETSGTGGV